MLESREPLNPLPGLELLSDGSVVVNGRRFDSSEGFQTPAQGDWSIHRAPGSAELTCLRGNGQTLGFSFADGEWIRVADDSSYSAQISEDRAESASEAQQQPNSTRIDQVYLKYCTLGKNEIFYGVGFDNHRSDIVMLTRGAVTIDGRMYLVGEDLDGVQGRASITEYYRYGGYDALLVAVDQNKATVYVWDYDNGWFELSKVTLDKDDRKKHFDEFKRWYRWRSILVNLISFGTTFRHIKDYRNQINTQLVVILSPTEKIETSDPSIWIRPLSRYTDRSYSLKTTKVLSRMWLFSTDYCIRKVRYYAGPVCVVGVVLTALLSWLFKAFK